MITYKTLIKEVKNLFPNLNYDSFFEDEPMIFMSNFIDFINNTIKNEDLVLLKEQMEFIDVLINSKDQDIQIIVDDMAIGAFDKSIYPNLRDNLSQNAKKRFDSVIEVWKKGNKLI
ncbi:hypothetical protein [Tenacibaculum agarivorans]|uniref:hypothetical protein n=1 Tax=Tenacibaculum agarivorans TaxID=1908389 RepID=UPI00094B921B|nr:hypothetical protein [Tenacibaculum agarivorans]